MKQKLFAASLLAMLLSACTNKQASVGNSDIDGADSTEVADVNTSEDPIEVSMSGTINPDKWTAGEEATVTFARFPKTVEGFKQIQREIGNTPQGAAALQLIAFEMYNQNKEVGEECVRLNNTEINVPSVMRRLPEIFGKNDMKDSYPRRHLVATFLAGATPENGFNPTRPYTVRVRSSKVHDYERAESLKGYVLYLDVYSTGYDTSWRGCEVVKQKGNDYYTVSNSPSMYVQCKDVPFDAKEDYKGI